METDNILSLKSNFVKGYFFIKPKHKKFISDSAKEKGVSQNQLIREILDEVIKNG